MPSRAPSGVERVASLPPPLCVVQTDQPVSLRRRIRSDLLTPWSRWEKQDAEVLAGPLVARRIFGGTGTTMVLVASAGRLGPERHGQDGHGIHLAAMKGKAGLGTTTYPAWIGTLRSLAAPPTAPPWVATRAG